MPEAATTVEQADDVAASVAAAIDALEADDTETVVDDAPADPIVPEDTDGTPGDGEPEPAADTETGETDEPDTETDTDTSLQEETETEAQVAYPEYWDKAHEAEFKELSPNMQKFMIDRHNEMTADYTRKTQETAEFKREYEPVHNMMRAFEPAMRSQGIGPGEMIRRWAVVESQLNSQPEVVIKQLAAHYGVDLQEAAYAQDSVQTHNQGYNGGHVDPKVQSLEAQVHNLQTNSNLAIVNAFAGEKDEQGQLAHPHFDDVLDDMMNDMRAAQAMGQQPALKDLYENACWKNTSVREKMLAAQSSVATSEDQKAEAEKKAQEARQKAARARKAAQSVSGDAGSSVETKPQYATIEEAAAAAYDNAT